MTREQELEEFRSWLKERLDRALELEPENVTYRYDAADNRIHKATVRE